MSADNDRGLSFRGVLTIHGVIAAACFGGILELYGSARGANGFEPSRLELWTIRGASAALFFNLTIAVIAHAASGHGPPSPYRPMGRRRILIGRQIYCYVIVFVPTMLLGVFLDQLDRPAGWLGIAGAIAGFSMLWLLGWHLPAKRVKEDPSPPPT